MTPQSPNEALQPEAPPPPPPRLPKKRRPTLSMLSGFVSFLAIVAIGALALFTLGRSRLQEPGPLTANKIVTIAPHTDLPDIIDKLASEGVIDSPLVLNVVLTGTGKRSQVKAAEYLFKAHASLQEVIDTLVSGKQYLHPFSVPEGLTSQQIVQRLKESDLLVGDVKDVPREGSLMPDTYKVYRGETRAAVIVRMQEADRKLVEQIWARRAPDLPLRAPYDMVTLASVVEKETGKADERSRVAGVFINRLRKHMRLQSDPTIVYGLVAGQGTLGHSITRSELDRRTPYNTYQIDGLPPGPIDNPGRAALEAVANPSRTPDLYFVADGSGGHAFSGTIEEHNRNVLRWRQIERVAKDKVDIDKLSPTATQPPPPGKPGDQRSDADDAAFGLLPTVVASTSLGPQMLFTDPTANHDIDRIAAAEERGVPPAARSGATPASPRQDPAHYANLDDMSFAFSDGQAKATAAVDLLDGPITESPAAATTAVAQTPSRATEPAETLAAHPVATRETRAASLDGGGAAHPDLFADPEGEAAPAKVPPAHPRIYDASENTPFDPLRNKSYDLNTAKTIPGDLVHVN